MGQAQKALTCLASSRPETPVLGPETPVWTGDSGQSPDPSPEGASDCPGLGSWVRTGGRSRNSGVVRRLRCDGRRLRSGFSNFLRLLFQASCLGVLALGSSLSHPLGITVMDLVIQLIVGSSRIPFK